MTHEILEKAVNCELDYAKTLLLGKNSGYSNNEDALAAFKAAAALQNTTPQNALFGMAAKNIGSVAKMCGSGEGYDLDVWEEKITDTINYMLLLYCIVGEEYMNERPIEGR